MVLPGGAEIEYQGNKLAASKSYLVFPDGNARVKDEYTLDQYGCYEAVFEAEANGLAVTATKSFTVKKSYYSVDKNSTISYGELNKSFANMGYKKGIKAELTEGGTLYYNKPINLYESNNFELIYLNCLQFDTVCKGMRAPYRLLRSVGIRRFALRKRKLRLSDLCRRKRIRQEKSGCFRIGKRKYSNRRRELFVSK